MRLLLGLLLACPLLAQPSATTITVTDALTGQPVADAKVALTTSDFRRYLEATSKLARRPRLQIETGTSGVARFEGLLEGVYLVDVTRKGYVGANQRGSSRDSLPWARPAR